MSGFVLYSKLLAALGPTALHDALAAWCAHAHQKTMGGLSLPVLWLVCSLWHIDLVSARHYTTLSKKRKPPAGRSKRGKEQYFVVRSYPTVSVREVTQ
jgi:hypothetical protein